MELSPDAYENISQLKPSRVANTCASIALAASLLTVGTYEGDDPSVSRCATDVSSAEYKQTETLLEQPDSTNIARARKLSDENILEIAVRNLAIHENNLTHIDPTTYLEPLKKDAKNGYNLPLSTYTESAERYLARYGLEFRDSGTEIYTDSSDRQIRDLSDKERNLDTAKQEVVTITDEVSMIPKEYFAFAGVKRFLIAKQKNAFASWHETSGTVLINATINDAGTPTMHEIFHGASNKLCGNFLTEIYDQDIEPHNLHEYGSNVPGKYTKDALHEKYMELKSLYDDHKITAVEADKQIDALRPDICFTDAYGTTNAGEDAAQIGRYFGSPWARGYILDPRQPHLRAKAIIWLARVREKAPQLFNYFNGVIPPIDKGRSHHQ